MCDNDQISEKKIHSQYRRKSFDTPVQFCETLMFITYRFVTHKTWKRRVDTTLQTGISQSQWFATRDELPNHQLHFDIAGKNLCKAIRMRLNTSAREPIGLTRWF
jgi:hypothetical protein